jgi:formylglycine-generating enzyme required for sulfatase activity
MALDMAAIPAGEFWMGDSDGDRNAFDDEKPRHKVKITQPFLLAKTKVTQALYEEVMGSNPSAFSPRGRYREKVKDRDTRLHPVESISWLDAVRFCNRLSEKKRLEPYYQIDGKTVTVRGGSGYRLPTEAEWEYACRAGTDTSWSFGEKVNDLDSHAWYSANSGDITHPVAEKKANPWGLFDMHGNVPEWCWDRYDAEYYRKSPTSDPPGPGTGDARVHRGGAWNSLAEQTRSSSREGRGLGYAVLSLAGLRVARSAEP